MAKNETQNTPEATPQTNQAQQNGQSGDGNQSQALAKPPQQGQLQRRDTLLSDPFTAMQRLASEMDDLFESFGFGRSPLFGRRRGPRFGQLAPLAQAAWSPQIEVEERGAPDGSNQFVVRADLPGLKKEDVKINVEDDALTITGERKDQREEKREGSYHSERSYGSFQRSIPLPEGVNADEVQASFRNGVLEVTIPTPPRQPSRSRQIEVQD
jgi:HSP20 family protein